MKQKCLKCNHIVKPELKMGGLICPKCRIILYTPDTEEFKKAVKDLK